MRLVFQQLEMSKRAHHPRHCALPGHQVGVQTGTSLTPAFKHIITAGALRQREAHTFLNNLCIRLITLGGGQVESSQQSNKILCPNNSMQHDSSDLEFSIHTASGMTWYSRSEHIWYLQRIHLSGLLFNSQKGYRGDRTRATTNYWWQQQQ